MGSLMKRSFMTITPYKTARQSFVVAYMYGVPVLASDIPGLNECFIHENTLYLVDPRKKIEKWVDCVEYIKKLYLFIKKCSRLLCG